MNTCERCGSKMPDELFMGDVCPICAMDNKNELHGLPWGTEFQGEEAQNLLEEAWQYYKPTNLLK